MQNREVFVEEVTVQAFRLSEDGAFSPITTGDFTLALFGGQEPLRRLPVVTASWPSSGVRAPSP